MKIAIIGRTEILYAAAKTLHARGHEISFILTSKEAPEYKVTVRDFEALADEWSAKFVCSSNATDALELLRAIPQIDVGISLNYSGIIPQSVIDCFSLGILNAHGGDLPRYRGNACQAWAILKGENRIGLCVHRMIGGELDNGDIVAREYLSISINTKITEVWNWMNERIPVLFEQAVDVLGSNARWVMESQSKESADALRCYPRLPEDGRIDWSDSAENILRLVNASNHPYPGAFCNYGPDKLVIWDACLVEDDEIYLAVPGQVISIAMHHVDIATGKGKLRLKEVQLGNDTLQPSQLIRSIRRRLT